MLSGNNISFITTQSKLLPKMVTTQSLRCFSKMVLTLTPGVQIVTAHF
jgi:hypothetical protein